MNKLLRTDTHSHRLLFSWRQAYSSQGQGSTNCSVSQITHHNCHKKKTSRGSMKVNKLCKHTITWQTRVKVWLSVSVNHATLLWRRSWRSGNRSRWRRRWGRRGSRRRRSSRRRWGNRRSSVFVLRIILQQISSEILDRILRTKKTNKTQTQEKTDNNDGSPHTTRAKKLVNSDIRYPSFFLLYELHSHKHRHDIHTRDWKKMISEKWFPSPSSSLFCFKPQPKRVSTTPYRSLTKVESPCRRIGTTVWSRYDRMGKAFDTANRKRQRKKKRNEEENNRRKQEEKGDMKRKKWTGERKSRGTFRSTLFFSRVAAFSA